MLYKYTVAKMTSGYFCKGPKWADVLFILFCKGPMWAAVLFSPSENTLVLGGVNNGLEHGGPPSIKRSQYALVLHFSSEQGNFVGGTRGRSQHTLVLHWRNPLVLERILDDSHMLAAFSLFENCPKYY